MIDKYEWIMFDLFDVLVPGLESFITKNEYYKFLLNYNHENLWKGNISYFEFLMGISCFYDFDVNKLIDNIFSNTTPDFDLVNLLVELKQNGKKLILVSDTYDEINTFLINNYDFINHFDDIYFSNKYKKTKKSGELFGELVKNGISPEKSLLIDDSNRNINHANSFGFNTHRYENFILLKKFLYE